MWRAFSSRQFHNFWFLYTHSSATPLLSVCVRACVCASEGHVCIHLYTCVSLLAYVCIGVCTMVRTWVFYVDRCSQIASDGFFCVLYMNIRTKLTFQFWHFYCSHTGTPLKVLKLYNLENLHSCLKHNTVFLRLSIIKIKLYSIWLCTCIYVVVVCGYPQKIHEFFFLPTAL